MTDYDKLSDFEINKLVAKYQTHDIQLTHPFDLSESSYVSIFISDKWIKYDPCNNPTDSWLIIIKNRISILFDYDLYTAAVDVTMDQYGYFQSGFEYKHKKPLRAAMIVFLMINEETK